MSLSNTAENLVLNWLLTTGAVTRPTTWFVALHLDDPGETGANEVTTSQDADYVRKSVTFGSASSGASTNTTTATWTVNAGSAGFTIRGVSIWDASTAGNCLASGLLYSDHAVVAGSVVSFNSGDLTVALD